MKNLAVIVVTLLAGFVGAAYAGTTVQQDAVRTHAVPQRVTITVLPATAAERRLGFDEHVVDANFAVRPGEPVTVTIFNHTRAVHTFSAPGLGVNVAILPGTRDHPSRTVFTFTAKRYGTFTWRCNTPCGPFMGGTIYAIIGETEQ